MISICEGLNNPLGFTRETAAVISGLGCTNLTNFKKRDINLDDLKYLTKEDLFKLGVDENFDFESFYKLSYNLRKKHSQPQLRSIDLLKIVESGYRQLQVINVYLKYMVMELSKSNTDYFIDLNKNLKVSQALIHASNYVLKEIKDLQMEVEESKVHKSKQNSKATKMKYYLLAGGLGTLILVYIFR